MSKKKVTQHSLIFDIVELMGMRTGTYKWEVHLKKETFKPPFKKKRYPDNWFYVVLTLDNLEFAGEGYSQTKKGALGLMLRQLKSEGNFSCSFKEIK